MNHDPALGQGFNEAVTVVARASSQSHVSVRKRAAAEERVYDQPGKDVPWHTKSLCRASTQRNRECKHWQRKSELSFLELRISDKWSLIQSHTSSITLRNPSAFSSITILAGFCPTQKKMQRKEKSQPLTWKSTNHHKPQNEQRTTSNRRFGFFDVL